MTAKRKQPTFKEKIIEKVISGINFNTIIITIAGGWFSYMGSNIETKQEQHVIKVDSAAMKMYDWRRGREIKDSIINRKLDSLISFTIKQKENARH